MSERRRPQRNRDLQGNDEDADIGDDEDQAKQQQRDRRRLPPAKRASTVLIKSVSTSPSGRSSSAKARHDKVTKISAARFLAPEPRRLQQRGHCERRSDGDEQHANEARKVSGLHGAGSPDFQRASEPQAEQAERQVEIAGEKVLAGEQRPMCRAMRALRLFCRAFTKPASSRTG